MTDEERRKLEEAHSGIKRLERALLEPDPRDPAGPPFINRVNHVVILVERSNWAARLLVRIILTCGAVTAALAGVWAFFQTGGHK